MRRTDTDRWTHPLMSARSKDLYLLLLPLLHACEHLVTINMCFWLWTMTSIIFIHNPEGCTTAATTADTLAWHFSRCLSPINKNQNAWLIMFDASKKMMNEELKNIYVFHHDWISAIVIGEVNHQSIESYQWVFVHRCNIVIDDWLAGLLLNEKEEDNRG